MVVVAIRFVRAPFAVRQRGLFLSFLDSASVVPLSVEYLWRIGLLGRFVADQDFLREAEALLLKEAVRLMKGDLLRLRKDQNLTRKTLAYTSEWAKRWLEPKVIYQSLSTYYWQVQPRSNYNGEVDIDRALANADPSFAKKTIVKFRPYP